MQYMAVLSALRGGRVEPVQATSGLDSVDRVQQCMKTQVADMDGRS